MQRTASAMWPFVLRVTLAVVCVSCTTASTVSMRGLGERQPSAPAAPASSGFGRVTCDHGSYAAELVGANYVHRLENDLSAEVPAGTYKLGAHVIYAKDRAGTTWRLTGSGSPAVLEVKRGETVPLKFGPPLTAEVTAVGKGPREYEFRVKLTGQGGAAYSPGSIWRENRRPDPPRLEVRAPSGQVVATGRFAYG